MLFLEGHGGVGGEGESTTSPRDVRASVLPRLEGVTLQKRETFRKEKGPRPEEESCSTREGPHRAKRPS